MIQISGPLFLSNYCSTLPDLVEAIRPSRSNQKFFFHSKNFQNVSQKISSQKFDWFLENGDTSHNVTSSVKVIGFPQVGNQSSVLYKGKFFCVRWFLFQFFSPLKSPSSNFPFFYISALPSQLAEVSNSQI